VKSKWPDVQAKIEQIAAWCRAGMLEKEIAIKLGISVSTLEKYKTEHPELTEALKNNEATANEAVENALYNKCIGYTYPEEMAFKCKRVFYDEQDRRCEEEHIETITVQKYQPPETMAQVVWLNNRCPSRWRRNAGKEQLDRERFEHDKEIDSKKYW
jgi:hypothetical protein